MGNEFATRQAPFSSDRPGKKPLHACVTAICSIYVHGQVTRELPYVRGVFRWIYDEVLHMFMVVRPRQYGSRRGLKASWRASAGADAAHAPTSAAASKRRHARASTTAGRGSADLDAFKTEVYDDPARTIITRNDSPDISFDRSINPYRGCEHGCIYCYARPTHCLSRALARPRLRDQALRQAERRGAVASGARQVRAISRATMAIGTNTDPYQPIERERRITRSILEVLDRDAPSRRHRDQVGADRARHRHPVARMARDGLVKVALSVTTLDAKLARSMEPRAATPASRLDAIARLAEAGIPTTVMVAPIIPGLNDSEIEPILEPRAKRAPRSAGYVLLRLPLEIKELFREWLATEHPDRAERVISPVAIDAWRPRLHGRVRRAPARHRPLRRADRAALPPGARTAGAQRAARCAAHRPVRATRARRATNEPALS